MRYLLTLLLTGYMRQPCTPQLRYPYAIMTVMP